MFGRTLTFALVLSALAGSAAAQAVRPSCTKVINEVNEQVRVRGGRPASSRVVAKRLSTEEAWVLQCMAAYGRVPAHRDRVADSEREAFDSALEEGRPMELDENNEQLRYQEEQRLRQERKEIHNHQREMAKQKEEFDNSSDPFYSAPNY